MKPFPRCSPSLLLGLFAALGCGSGNNVGPEPITVDRVTVSPPTVDLLVGGQQAFSATALAADGSTIAGKTAAWSSNNTTAATVNPTTGLVTAVGGGSAVITAVIDGRSGQATVQVTVPTQRLTVTTSGSGNGTITSSPTGINCTRTAGVQSGSCAFDFPQGTTVTLTATSAAGGHAFGGWTAGGCTGTAPCQVTMSQARQVEALVHPPRQTLTVVLSGTGTMSMTSVPAGIACGRNSGTPTGTCTATFDRGTVVTLSRTSPPLNLMATWTGAGCDGSWLDCQVTMSQDWVVSASVLAPTSLTVAIVGAGRVTSQPEGIDCQRSAGGAVTGSCTTALTATSSRRLTATPANGFQFAGWTGANCPGTGFCDATPVGALTVTATFTALAPDPVVSVAVAGTGSGAITSAPAGISCTSTAGAASGTCNSSFAQGTTVTLTAQAAGGSTFTGWNGEGCSGTGSCVVQATQARQVTATFSAAPSLTVLISGTGSGSITSTPAGINCVVNGGTASGVCGASFPSGTEVRLDRQLAAGSLAAGWDGACTGTMHCTLTLTADRTVTAHLRPTGGALGIGFGAEQFALVNPGTFQMGSATGFPDEPVRSVTITQAYRIQKTEVTHSQWMQIMGSDPGTINSCFAVCPVRNVSWNQVQAFLAALNAWDPGKNYRLATEAQWEYAARAGTTGDYGGTGIVDQMGWYSPIALNAIWPVARKAANAWGLYDMHGNVGEWVQDWYGAYPAGPLTNPTGPASGTWRAIRGGSYSHDALNVRSSVRHASDPGSMFSNVGFRLVRNP